VGPTDRIFAALPFGWGVPLLLGPVLALQTGASLGFFESDATILTDLRSFGPTVLAGPAALFRRLRQIVWTDAARAGGLGRTLLQYGLGLVAEDGVPNRLAGALVVAPTRDRLGLARLHCAVSYGEPVPPRIAAFWDALGIKLSHFTAPAKFGSSPGVGPDAALRHRLRGSPYVRDAWVVAMPNGEFAALVAPDGATVATWAQAQGEPVDSLKSLGADERVHTLIAGEIWAAATADSRITTYLLAAGGFDSASGEATPEGRLRPAIVERAHAAALQRLRAGGGRVVAAAVEPEMDWEHLVDPLTAAVFRGYGI
jgi:long-subunit acyl-CoA synthetase (AMP-forming)